VTELAMEARDSRILAAAPFDPARLQHEYADRLHVCRSVAWNRDADRIEAFEEHRFDALVLARRAVAVRDEDAVPALLAQIRARGLECLPWADAARTLRHRVQAVRGWGSGPDLPDMGDSALLA